MRDIIFIGDGLGVRTLPAKMMGLNVLGTDISKYAIEHSYCKDLMIEDDIANTKLIEMNEKAKVIILYDICEHLTDEQLDKCLKNIIRISNNFLFSIPYIDDPNLEADATHKQFHDKQWWISKIESYGIKVKDAPQDWLFSQQLLIGERDDK
jgi:hypothetical protein